MAELAVRSGIERSTLYQYIRGSRPLKSRSQLEILMAELQLTPDERLELVGLKRQQTDTFFIEITQDDVPNNA